MRARSCLYRSWQSAHPAAHHADRGPDSLFSSCLSIQHSQHPHGILLWLCPLGGGNLLREKLPGNDTARLWSFNSTVCVPRCLLPQYSLGNLCPRDELRRRNMPRSSVKSLYISPGIMSSTLWPGRCLYHLCPWQSCSLTALQTAQLVTTLCPKKTEITNVLEISILFLRDIWSVQAFTVILASMTSWGGSHSIWSVDL